MAEYIDRDALLKHKRYISLDRYEIECIVDVDRIIEATPADVAPVKHGKWIGYQTNSFKNSSEGLKRKFYRCSICHTANAICAKYCPNCGAKMDENEN